MSDFLQAAWEDLQRALGGRPATDRNMGHDPASRNNTGGTPADAPHASTSIFDGWLENAQKNAQAVSDTVDQWWQELTGSPGGHDPATRATSSSNGGGKSRKTALLVGAVGLVGLALLIR